jgi:ABC-type transport system involved in multi-copper enzyme maturation permease subunit
MSTITTPAPTAVQQYVSPVSAKGVSFMRVLQSEWTKLRTLRSTWATLATAVVLMVGVAALVSSVVLSQWDTADAVDRATFDAMSIALAGLTFASIAIAALGVMTITGEYSTGAIRGSLLAVPRRTPVLVAKAVLLAVVTYVTMLVASLASFGVTMTILSSKGISAALGDTGVLRVLLGAPAYLAVVALLGLAVGALLRSTPAGITTLLGVLLVLPPLAFLLPGKLGDTLSHWLPSNAGQQVTLVTPDPSGLAPWLGLGVAAAYAVVLLVVAAVMLRRRDA